MGLTEEYLKLIKTPSINIHITKWPDGVKPSVDPPWYGDSYEFNPNIINCNISFAYDQGSSSCAITIETPYDDGSPVIFEPMNKVVVEQGWNNVLQTTYFGFIDTVTLEDFPRTQTLNCRDILKLANNYYFVHSNRLGYYFEIFDDDGENFGGQQESERYAEVIIADLLEDAGIPSNRYNLVPMQYYVGATPVRVVIGNNTPWVIEYRSAMDAINSICDLLGYRIWATPDGMVKLRYERPFASVGYAQEYSTVDGHLLSIKSNVSDDELRNRVEIRGYDYGEAGQVYAVEYADSDYVPDPPQYRRMEVVSDLIDTDAMAEWMAEIMLRDLNRLHYSANVTIEGDPRLQIGQTIRIDDPYAASSTNYFVYDYSTRLSSPEYSSEVSLVGGIGVGSEANDLANPVAIFAYTMISGASLNILCDATISYDPDGSISSYLWESSGYDNQSDITASFYVANPSGITSLTVTLTVTDGDALEDSSAQVITWSGVI